MKYKLAVIGANAPLLPFYSQIDRNLFEVYGFAWAEGAVCRDYCDRFFPISFTEKDEILQICREIGIDGITSFSLESAVPTVIYIAQQMGLPSNTPFVEEWVGNKDRMRAILTENNVSYNPRFMLINREEELDSIDIPFPIIVKPDDGGGSKGVSFVNSKDELLKAYRYSTDNSRSKKVIAEEYVEGEEVSVEYISYKGQHHFLAITDKTTSGIPNFIELKHHQPSTKPQDICEKIRETVEKALDVMGIDNSPSHTEVRIGKNGVPTIIEIGPRMGGGYITSHLVRLSTGYDFVNNNCRMVCGMFVKPGKLEKNKATVLFKSPFTKEQFYNLTTGDKDIVLKEIDQDSDQCNSNAERTGVIIYTEQQ